MELIKLIWDFRGPNAAAIAKHHAIHLNEFIHSEKLQNSMSGTESISEMHHIAFMITEKELMQSLRERLKPNRGQLYTK
ncbi:MAG: hypothetical protein KJO05_08585 [Bacteroidia bacterium]|nr:hypothetical protein [Bacteroidia bacterium]NNF31911.1 hypothetical protein [Flavobacteriaceae bacterium]MBT8277026.1 hypothetical protein [Bacteroidia bacterium]NNJ81927.1 hypothetical protein [Flavobacteriaceae bacterium]NNK53599.1 hypothetical protein [Flavobacteriaceae bacterium]